MTFREKEVRIRRKLFSAKSCNAPSQCHSNIIMTANLSMFLAWIVLGSLLCNFTLGQVCGPPVLQPRVGSFLGGSLIRVLGICLTQADSSNIRCDFGGVVVPGTYIGSTEARCITPASGTSGGVMVQVSKDGGNSFITFPSFFYVEDFPNYNAVHENEEDWETGSWAGTAYVSYNQADLSGVSQVNLDYIAAAPGNPVDIKETRLVTDASNNGQISMPSRLALPNIAISIYGALRVTPSPADGRMLWVRPGISHWYLKLVFSELETREKQSEQQPTLELFPAGSFNIEASEILQAVRDFVQDTTTQVNIVTYVMNSVSGNLCLWFHSNDRNAPTDFSDLLSPPCTFRQAITDGRFDLDSLCNQNTALNRLFCDIFHQGAANCIRSRRPILGKGQQACYDSIGRLLSFHQGGGTVDKFHPRTSPIYHIYFDVIPYLFCCKFSDNCDKYGEMRPTQGCDGYQPPSPGFGFGDPHFKTLDGLDYTFNAHGEFLLLSAPVNNLTVQGRMTPVVDPQGNSLPASVWTAFALKIGISETVQVEISGNAFQILINGVPEDFSEVPSQQFTSTEVELYQTSPPEVLVAFTDESSLEASMRITLIEGTLNYVLTLASGYQSGTTGLLGDKDGNPDNDIQKRNGEILPSTTEGQALHNALLTWRTTASESIFTYGSGESHATYQNEGFQPDFPSVDNLVNHPQASVCSGDFACLYDLSATNDPSFASQTKSASSQMQQMTADSGTTISCGTPNDIPNGNVTYTGTSQSNRAYYTCNQNYQIIGDSTATCRADGAWSGSPSCSQNQVAGGTQLQISATLTAVLLIAIGAIHFLQ